MLENSRVPRIQWRSAILAGALTIALTACGSDDDPLPEPSSAAVVVDVSGSVTEGTDLVAAAENRVAELIDDIVLPGGTVVVKAAGSNTNDRCVDLKFTVDAENDPVLDQVRNSAKRDLSAKFDGYIRCVEEFDTGGTQLFGLLSETAMNHPDATTWDVYTDGFDNHDTHGIGKLANLRDPDFPSAVVSGLHPALVPELSDDTTITWHFIGQGRDDLGSVEKHGLRQIFELWTTATGASASFVEN